MMDLWESGWEKDSSQAQNDTKKRFSVFIRPEQAQGY